MSIDFDDLELLMAELVAVGAERPRPEVRERLMATILADPASTPTGFVFSLADTDHWFPHPVPGIRMRVLSVNRDHGYATLLLDVKPGTRFPAHHHTGPEECYVVSGEVYTWGRRMGPGDFLHAEAGTDHGELWTATGAQVILVVPPEDYMPDPKQNTPLEPLRTRDLTD
jgi:quercetin dioxygenase-like cupin family protein